MFIIHRAKLYLLQVATVGTFSAASLEGLRMLLSGLEGGGGKIALPVALNASNLASEALLLLPAIVSGVVIGKTSLTHEFR